MIIDNLASSHSSTEALIVQTVNWSGSNRQEGCTGGGAAEDAALAPCRVLAAAAGACVALDACTASGTDEARREAVAAILCKTHLPPGCNLGPDCTEVLLLLLLPRASPCSALCP